MSFISEQVPLAKIGNAEILPLKTDTVPPYTSTNTVFLGRQSFFIIDPATKDTQHQEILRQYIETRLGYGERALAILLTHHHGDHLGAVSFLQEKFNLALWAHSSVSELTELSVDNSLDEGDDLIFDDNKKIKVFHTPGHAESHLVFLDSSFGCLVAGDMITDRGTILIPPNSGSLKIYLENLERLCHLSMKAIIPAHGQIITKQPQKFLLNAMKHRYERILQIWQVLEKNEQEMDGTEITNAVYKKELPDNMLFFAQLSVESSLHWLKEQGLADYVRYRWQLSRDALMKQKLLLLDPLEEIHQRLRNT